MVGRFSFWRCTLWTGVASLLIAAAPYTARSLVVEDQTSVTFHWAEASGPVLGYVVMLHIDGSVKPTPHSVVSDNQVTIEGSYDQTLQISVVAYGPGQSFGPLSEFSDLVEFVSTGGTTPPDSGSGDPGGDNPEPVPDPEPEPVPDPEPEPDPDPVPEPDPDPSPSPGFDPYPFTRFDHDGDGFADVLVRRTTKEAIRLWTLDAQGILDNVSAKNFGSRNVPVGNGDYNGDGFADILWFDIVNFRVSLSFMEAGQVRRTIVVTQLLEAPSEIAGSGDYNGDALSDILIYTPDTNAFTLWTSNGDDSFAVTELPDEFGNAAEVIASGDFDGDGMTDILWRESATGDVEIWGTTQEVTLGPLEGAGSFWRIMGAGDFDGDSRDDVMLQNSKDASFAVRLSSNGVRTTLGSILNSRGNERSLAATGDYNGDGRLDLLVEHPDLGEAWLYFLNGSAITGAVQIDALDSNWYFASTDARPNERRGERR